MQRMTGVPLTVPGFDVQTRVSGTTRTVAVSGEIDLAVSHRLAAMINRAIEARPETVLVDLACTGFIDSSGMHAIVAGHRHAEARSVRLVVIPGPPAVQRAFELCGLTEVLRFVSSPDTGTRRPDPWTRHAAGRGHDAHGGVA